ncbi:hypothetical protein EB796_021986 [Bugula neritina]|uniref:Uncharacterized protein n=1 Tax=Bugula neritina TaxID=10212 RepID=A0A7J7J2T4_BUGNE|nr:hypothetical protein EB796_021986 [Bugula neritina]
MEEDVQDKSQMLVIVLGSHNIKTLLKQTLAVQIIRESEYSPSKIVSKLQSIHENVNGKNKSFSEDLQEMIVMLVKVLSTFDPTKPTTTKDAPTPWNISLEKFLSIHQPTILHNLDDKFITKICSSLADLEDDIIDTFPSLGVFEVTDGVLSKLPCENRHTQLEAIEGLITALLIDITEEIKPNYEKLITATIVSSGAILESLDVVNRQRNKSVHGESFPTSSELTRFVKEYSNCVRYFIGEIKCYPYANELEIIFDLVLY